MVSANGYDSWSQYGRCERLRFCNLFSTAAPGCGSQVLSCRTVSALRAAYFPRMEAREGRRDSQRVVTLLTIHFLLYSHQCVHSRKQTSLRLIVY